jgi:hypothetical protein
MSAMPDSDQIPQRREMSRCANTGSGGLYFKLGVPRMSAREPTSLITS